jgi:hypothetical protein
LEIWKTEVKIIRLKKITFGKITTFVHLPAGKVRFVAKKILHLTGDQSQKNHNSIPELTDELHCSL